MDKISTALKGYLSKAKDQLTQAKQSFFNTPTPPTKDNPPPETAEEELDPSDMQNANDDENAEEAATTSTVYSPKFHMDIDIPEEETPGRASCNSNNGDDGMSIDGTEYRNVLDTSTDCNQSAGSDQNNAEAEDPMVADSTSTPPPPPPDTLPALGSMPAISFYTRVLTLKEEYALYGASAYDPFSSRRGNPTDRRPVIRHFLCCDNCDRVGHRWMHCPEPCWECGSFHMGYLMCGSRDRKRKGDQKWSREEDAKRVRLRGYTEKMVPEKAMEEWVPLLVENVKSKESKVGKGHRTTSI
ncbi:hypothetical protein V8E51_004121 [Hyaloscypha variabilis]